MKKTVILLILAIGFLSFNKLEIKDSTGKLTETELTFVKESYNWNSEEFIIINFRQPENSCQYDNYKNLKKSVRWWTKFYSKMELANVRNIFIYSDSEKARGIIDSKTRSFALKMMNFAGEQDLARHHHGLFHADARRDQDRVSEFSIENAEIQWILVSDE